MTGDGKGKNNPIPPGLRPTSLSQREAFAAAGSAPNGPFCERGLREAVGDRI